MLRPSGCRRALDKAKRIKEHLACYLPPAAVSRTSTVPEQGTPILNAKRHFCGLPLWFALLVVSFCGCSRLEWQARFLKPNSIPIDDKNSFLKCHQKNGELIVLDSWDVDLAGRSISGRGIQYDAQRKEIARGHVTIPLDTVALFETNRPQSVERTEIAVIGLFTAASAVASVLCLANPKACFGSCPTFYAFDGQQWKLVAEGFSSSIAKVFEATDVDALYTAVPTSSTFELVMRNEALETHAVRQVNLLRVPRRPGERIFRAGEAAYFTARSVVSPRSCSSMLGDCLPAVAAMDDAEYRSPAG